MAVALAIVGISAMIIGTCKNRRAWQSFGLIVTIIALCLFVLQLFIAPGTTTAGRRVVYSKDGQIVVIDDENGRTERLSLKKVAHENATYSVGDGIVVIYNQAGAPVYITTDEVVPQQAP